MAKRINLVMSDELYNRLQKRADENDDTVSAVIKDAVKLLLLATEPDTTLLIRRPGMEEASMVLL